MKEIDVVLLTKHWLETKELDEAKEQLVDILLKEYMQYHKFYPAKCEVCGTEFLAKRSDGGMYCSNKCSNRAWMARMKADPEKYEERKRKCRESARRRRALKKKVE